MNPEIFRKNKNNTNENFSKYLNKYVYEPAEDSELILKSIKSYLNNDEFKSSKLSLLEIGSGSGFLSENLINKVKNITITDINPYAIKYLKNKFKNNKNITIKKSNLFREVKKQYDIIIFNPPYLPSDPLDPDDWLNKALVGGKKGNEIILKFIKQLPRHMKQKSKCFLLFSSLSSPNEIFNELEKYALIYNKKDELSFEFETIYVYEIFKSKIYNYTNHNPTLFNHGKKGNIYKSKNLAIKKNKKIGMVGNIKTEYNIIKDLNTKYTPKVKKFDTDYDNNDFFTYKFIRGQTLEQFFKNEKKRYKILKIIKKLILTTYKLDKKSIWKKEFNKPYKNTLIKYPKVYLIDFERASYSKKTNLNQLLSFCKGAYMKNLFTKHNIEIDIEKLKKLELEYRKNKNNIKKIIKCFK